MGLYGITQEDKGAKSYNEYLKGEVLHDEEKVFYGPKPVRMLLLGLLRFSTYRSGWNAYSAGVKGNLKGDGTLLGSTLVIGPGDQGILFEYRSKDFGDKADVQEVLKAVKKISKL